MTNRTASSSYNTVNN